MEKIFNNLREFVPQEGVKYKYEYQNFLNNPDVMRDAQRYIKQQGKNVFTHLNNYYLALIRKHVLIDNFFIFYFVSSNTNKVNHNFVVQMCANTDYDFQLYKDGKESRFLEERARGHIKTKNNESLAAQCVLTYPEDSLLFCAFRSSSAKKSVESVKALFEMPEVKHAFSDILYADPKKDTTWSLSDGLLVKRKKVAKDKTVEYCGFYEGSNTGGHYRFLFLDDIMTKDMKDSPKMIQLGKEHFDNIGNLSDFGNQDSATMVRVTGTPYAWDDVIKYVGSKVYDDGTLMYKSRKIREADDNDVPIFVTQSEHEINKRSDNYLSQQQLDPSPIKSERLNWDDIVMTDYIPKDLMKFIVVDPAGGITDFDTAERDNWAVICVGVEYGRDLNGLYNLYIIDMVLRNMTEDEAPNIITKMYRNHRDAHAICIEQSYQGYLATLVKNMVQSSMGETISEADNSLIRLHAQTRGNKKNNIYKQLKKSMTEGKVHLNTAIPEDFILAFKKEVVGFPTIKHDDALDSLSYKDTILEKLYYDYRVSQHVNKVKSNKVTYMDKLREKKRRRSLPDQNYMYK